jgi:hypothetical protein
MARRRHPGICPSVVSGSQLPASRRHIPTQACHAEAGFQSAPIWQRIDTFVLLLSSFDSLFLPPLLVSICVVTLRHCVSSGISSMRMTSFIGIASALPLPPDTSLDCWMVGALVEGNARAPRHLRAVTAAEAAENHRADGDGADDAEGAAELAEVHAGQPTQDAAGAGEGQNPADPRQAGEPELCIGWPGRRRQDERGGEKQSQYRCTHRNPSWCASGVAHLPWLRCRANQPIDRGMWRIAGSCIYLPNR